MRPPLDGLPPPALPQPRASLRLERGRMAEEMAAAYLRLRGYTILERNCREGPRELDLIARHEGWLVMVEVRFRSSGERGLPEETVRWRKRRDLLRAGLAAWRRIGSPGCRLRFDLISILLNANGLEIRQFPHFIVPDRRT
jgi:putative endonuclease